MSRGLRRSDEWYADYRAKAKTSAYAEQRVEQAIPVLTDRVHMPSGDRDRLPATKKSKYRNVKTGRFASKREAEYSAVLETSLGLGLVRNIREQVRYLLVPKQEGERACFYVADFVFDELQESAQGDGWNDVWREVVVDCKSDITKTPAYVIKRKLMLFVHGVKVREV